MVNTRRLVASAIAAAILGVAAMAVDRSGPVGSAPARPLPTIEPTLPLVIEMHFEDIGRGAGGTSAVLVVAITGADAISDLVLETTLSAGLRPAGLERLPRGPMHFARDEVRRFTLPVTGDRNGRHAVRVEAVFRDAAGRTLRLGQGATLEPAATATGRSHLGAFEMMAVPIEEIPR